MVARYYNLVLAIGWVFVAGCIFAHDLLPPQVARLFRGGEMVLVGSLALMLAVYNVVRWWANLARDRRRGSFRTHALASHPRDEPEPYLPNPELDFLKVPDADDRPKPSVNGDHKG